MAGKQRNFLCTETWFTSKESPEPSFGEHLSVQNTDFEITHRRAFEAQLTRIHSKTLRQAWWGYGHTRREDIVPSESAEYKIRVNELSDYINVYLTVENRDYSESWPAALQISDVPYFVAAGEREVTSELCRLRNVAGGSSPPKMAEKAKVNKAVPGCRLETKLEPAR